MARFAASLVALTVLGAALVDASVRSDAHDPLAFAVASIGRTQNFEAGIPAQCYTKTGGVSNVCWTCHTTGIGTNYQTDCDLQREYAFSRFALENRWSNLFEDRSAAIATIGDEEILRWIRTDNYAPLRAALTVVEDYPGYRPDLDLAAGFDEGGFARDGSGWRALRYKPFPGTFWPTNGSTDDVMIRLPREFRTREGREDRELYKANLALLEAAIAGDPRALDAKAVERRVEPVSEEAAGLDLDGDGEIEGHVEFVRGLPANYAGDAARIPLRRYVYPAGTEFLHTVRYVDPDSASALSTRLKELRYSRKVRELDSWGMLDAYAHEEEEKEEGKLPKYTGSPLVGLLNSFGWQLQGFIEDAEGRLRLQTEEEHRACMGCHSALGVTVDQTFAFARKVPGRAGWAHQDARGIPDVPQAGHTEPEYLTWFARAGAGDEFRANAEMLARFFPDGALDERSVRRAAPGGDRDIAWLVTPSRERALALDKAYLALVRAQRFDLGRDTLLGALENVHAKIEDEDTGLAATGMVFGDGRLWLDWSAVER